MSGLGHVVAKDRAQRAIDVADGEVGPHQLTAHLRQTQFVDHRLRLIPVRHVFQGTYGDVKQRGATPLAVDPRPLHHHWVHVWIEHPFDVAQWLVDH